MKDRSLQAINREPINLWTFLTISFAFIAGMGFGILVAVLAR